MKTIKLIFIFLFVMLLAFNNVDASEGFISVTAIEEMFCGDTGVWIRITFDTDIEKIDTYPNIIYFPQPTDQLGLRCPGTVAAHSYTDSLFVYKNQALDHIYFPKQYRGPDLRIVFFLNYPPLNNIAYYKDKNHLHLVINQLPGTKSTGLVR